MKILKTLGKTVLGIILAILILLAIEWCCSRIGVGEHTTASAETFTIYLKSNGVHTDIVMPTQTEQIDWRTIFHPEHIVSKDSTLPYIGIGWGDKGFFMQTPEWSDLKFSVAFNAMFGLGGSAIHATYQWKPDSNELCVPVVISKAQYDLLIDYIKAGLTSNDTMASIYIPTDAQYGNYDAFYEANGSYSMLRTCNTWTNNALKHAKLKAAFWCAFDKGILRQYR